MSDGHLVRDELAIPVIEEQITIEKRVVPTGTVRIQKTVREREQVVDEPLRNETFEVRRVAVNRPIDSPVPVRQDGDTTIYPVMEEVLVVTKQLILREEVHVTRRVAEVHKPQSIKLSSEEITIERDPGQVNTSI